MPPRIPGLLPFEEVACDSIGPWTIHLNGQALQFRALTIIDTVSNLCEAVRVQDAGSVEAGRKFEASWLYRYPRPERCIHDNGPEFQYGFLRVLQAWGIKNVSITPYNPQANSICERLHQTVGNILQTYIHTNPPQNAQEAASLVDRALNIATYAMRSTIHRTLKVTPGALVFHRDMLLNIPLQANLLQLRDRRQALIDDNLLRQNAKRIDYAYRIGDYIAIIPKDRSRLDPTLDGRFRITRIYANGTVDIQRGPHIVERINIRRIKPVG